MQGDLVRSDGTVEEAGDFAVTAKPVSKGKAVNGFVFSRRLADAQAAHFQAGWFEQCVGTHVDMAAMACSQSHRICIVEMFRGPRLYTWDEAAQSATLTVMRCVEAFRA